MEVPIELAFHGIEHSDALEELVRDRIDRLETHFDHIISCRVVIEAPHRDSEQEIRSARVRIDLAVPGKEIIAVSEPQDHQFKHNDVYSAIDASFDKMERQLRDHAGSQQEGRRDTRFPTEANAIIASIDPTESSGYVELVDGREIYFQEAALQGGKIADLEPGDDVKVVVGSRSSSPYPVARRVRVA